MPFDPYALVTTISYVLLALVFVKLFFFLNFSVRHHVHHKRHHPSRITGEQPMLVSIIVPSYNEEATLENSVKGLLAQTYHHCEIVIVNDGSTDNTLKIARAIARKNRKVRVFNRKNAGKAAALNYGIKKAWGSIIVCMDADSIFRIDTIEQLVLSFEDPEVVAVGGNVRVANRQRTLGKQQAIEYITGLTIQRRAFAHIGCMQVISGAIGAFRKEQLMEIGGYSTDTIVEDMDLTVSLARKGYKVVYNPSAIAYTEAPESLRDFIKQRYRWVYGGFQVAIKHRNIVLNPKYGRIGMIGMPYFVIFPWVDVVVSTIFFAALIHLAVTGSGFEFLIFYAAMTILQGVLIFYAMVIDKEDRRLALMAGIDNLFYNHVISFVTLRAGINFIMRRKTKWNKLKRLGKNTLPQAEPVN